MLRGRFGNTSGAPYIDARLILPRLGLTSDISFLVDTGADRTALLASDGMRMAIDYTQLGDETETVGVGGVSKDYQERAFIAFSDPGKTLYGYQLNILVMAPSAEIMDLPSLLGRDILNSWKMNYNPHQGRLTFKVWSADIELSLTT